MILRKKNFFFLKKKERIYLLIQIDSLYVVK